MQTDNANPAFTLTSTGPLNVSTSVHVIMFMIMKILKRTCQKLSQKPWMLSCILVKPRENFAVPLASVILPEYEKKNIISLSKEHKEFKCEKSREIMNSHT